MLYTSNKRKHKLMIEKTRHSFYFFRTNSTVQGKSAKASWKIIWLFRMIFPAMAKKEKQAMKENSKNQIVFQLCK